MVVQNYLGKLDSFIYLFIHPSNKYLSGAYNVTSTMLGFGNRMSSKGKLVPDFVEFIRNKWVSEKNDRKWVALAEVWFQILGSFHTSKLIKLKIPQFLMASGGPKPGCYQGTKSELDCKGLGLEKWISSEGYVGYQNFSVGDSKMTVLVKVWQETESKLRRESEENLCRDYI